MKVPILPSLILTLLGVLASYGTVVSCKKRTVDRRHLAAFVGYVALTVAVIALIVAIVVTVEPYPSSVRQGFTFIICVIWLLATLAVFIGGALSAATQRILLLVSGIMICVSYVLLAGYHFGD